MGFVVTHLQGDMERDPNIASLGGLYAELAGADQEHGDVSVKNEEEWCLSAYASGLLVFGNLEQGEPRHMRKVPASEVLRLWRALATDDLQEVERQPWAPGYG